MFNNVFARWQRVLVVHTYIQRALASAERRRFISALWVHASLSRPPGLYYLHLDGKTCWTLKRKQHYYPEEIVATAAAGNARARGPHLYILLHLFIFAKADAPLTGFN